MAKITYTDLDGSAPVVTWHGERFEDGQAVETDNALLIAQADGNSHFKVTGATKADAEEAAAENAEIRRRGRPPRIPVGVPDEDA